MRTLVEAAPLPAIVRSPGYWSTVWRRFRRDPVGMAALMLILVIVLVAIFAPLLAPSDPYKGMALRRLKPPGTPGFPLGTDELGRDMLTRLMYGARLSLFMGVTPVFIALFIGSAIGITAGYLGGLVNTVHAAPIPASAGFPGIGFESIPAQTRASNASASAVLDQVRVPTGYKAELFVAWGDQIGRAHV